MVREANRNDLDEILQLYLYLHETNIPEDSEQLRNTWDCIMKDTNHHLIVCEDDAAHGFKGGKHFAVLSECRL